MTINTAKVTGRRALKFTSLDDIVAEVDRLSQGKIRSLGNWSPGQNLKHCSLAMIGCLDGIDARAPWFLRMVAPLLFKNRFLTKPMSAGFQLPKSAAVLLPGEATWDEGLDAIRTGLTRLKTEAQRHPHPLLGELTREQWDQLHCRHCELHLSFLIPE